MFLLEIRANACFSTHNESLTILATGIAVCAFAVGATDKMLVALHVDTINEIVVWGGADTTCTEDIIVYFNSNTLVKDVVFTSEKALWVFLSVTVDAPFDLVNFIDSFLLEVSRSSFATHTTGAKHQYFFVFELVDVLIDIFWKIAKSLCVRDD